MPNYRLMLLLTTGLFLTACEDVTISQIKEDPARFRDKTVLVRGTVTTGFGILSKGGYVVEDKTESISITIS